ncbi:cytochrome P450 [Bimuria novae-zelandiae CBS 107.79]|uniref:Cytochrome P450 n=1 Tax=Bimuria novae-zelandiae CBS 107.79 TaxID=1447943 RepID=A0A6A5VZW0_9PLEO|nr:cytochrome P450 [Bimuria novae-zelandiae CBS 107.79]
MGLVSSPITFVAVGALLSYLIFSRVQLYLNRRSFIKQHGCEPCPKRYNKEPIIGYDVLKETIANFNERKMLERNQKRYRDMGVNTFLTKIQFRPMIATCEPENVKAVLSKNFKDYSLGNRNHSFGPLLGDGIFNSDGEKWANSRHLLRPNFARDQIADLEAFDRHFRLMMKKIPKDGSIVDLQHLFFQMTIDSATEFLFNHSTDSLRMSEDDVNNEDAIFARAFMFAQEDIIHRDRWGFLNFLRPNKEGKDAIKICHTYVDKFVDQAIREHQAEMAAGKADNERYIFIKELVKQTQDKERIRNELMNILLAGRDTTASLLSNMFFQLALRPDIWAKLREEVAPLEGRLPTYEELKNMKYLKWCMNESLRLHPVVPSNSRFAIKDTVLPIGGGPSGTAPLFVPKGTVVSYSPYAMHRREDLYGPDAAEFKPERWETLRPGWEYLPFNGGPRICLGQQYALTEAGFVTVRLLQAFSKIESRDPKGGVWEESLTLTLCSANGCQVSLTPA